MFFFIKLQNKTSEPTYARVGEGGRSTDILFATGSIKCYVKYGLHSI